MDIKATKLQNTAPAEGTQTRTVAKTTATSTSFVDELSTINNLGADNSIETKPTVEQNTTPLPKETTKTEDFKFVSTPKDFSNKLNKENLSQTEKQILRQNAEKKLVDEIVLMNKQDVKSSKTEIKNAHASVSQKSDNQIEEEKKDLKQAQNWGNETITLLQENPKNENNDKIIVSLSSEKTEQNQIKLTTKDEVETFDKIDFEPAKNDEKSIKPELISQTNKILKTNKDETQSKTTNVVTNETENVKTFDLNNKNSNKVSEINNEQNKNETREIKTQKDTAEINVKTDKITVEADKNLNVKQNKNEIKDISTQNEFKNIVETNENIDIKLNKKAIKDVSTEKIAENIIDLDKNINLKPNKIKNGIVDNIKTKDIKNNKKENGLIDVTEDVSKVDISKNISKKDIEVAKIEDLPMETEEIKVIKFEPITSPVLELDKSLNSTKTSDIVKFLDANLTTNNTTKTTKSASTKTTSEKASEKTIKMTEADAKFFNNLIETNQQIIDGTKTTDANNHILKEVEDASSVQVSKSLLNALKESQENNKSFRVDFDKDLSVILKVNKDGVISAEFLPGDKAVEQYLKANLPLLQQQFKDEGLKYENLSYRQSKKDDDDKQKQNNRNNKKENGYE